MQESVLVSVIMPTYKRTDYLKRAIDSIVSQTYRNIELVIADDNVSESEEHLTVLEICNNYKSSINVQYVWTGGHVGGGVARNIACSHATGKYLCFLDDDDVYLPDKVRVQLEFMVKNNLDMSFMDVTWLNEKDEIVEIRSFDYITDCSNESLLKEHLLHNIAPTSIYMIKRESFNKTKGFGDLKVGQDIYLMFQCINLGMKIAYMPGSYVNQYLHSGERISIGRNKIEGENWWYKEKQKYISVLDKKQIAFFRFRHYIILFFACLRSNFYFRALQYGIIAFFCSPKDSIIEGKKYLKGKKTDNHNAISKTN